MNKEIRKNLPTVLVGAGTVMGITGAVTAWFGAKKAAKELSELDENDPNYKKRKVLIIAKNAAVPAACLAISTGCNIAANEMNIQTITTLTSIAVAAEAKAEKHEKKLKQVLKDKLKIEDKEADKIVDDAKKEADKELIEDGLVLGKRTKHNDVILHDQCSGWTGWGNICDVQEAYAEALRECMPEEDWRVYGDGYMNPVKKHTLDKGRWLEILEKHLDNFAYLGGHGDDFIGWKDVKNDFVIEFDEGIQYDDDHCTPGTGTKVVDIVYRTDAEPYNAWED